MIRHSSHEADHVKAHPQPAAKPTILLVDDDEAIRFVFSEALRAEGYHVDTAENGLMAWELLGNPRGLEAGHSYDLLITDNSMPLLSGGALVLRLREAEVKMPVVMIAGAVPQAEIRGCLSALLLKPFSLQLLFQTVARILTTNQGRCSDQQDSFNLGGRPTFYT